ncbi:MAG TPA: non-homologous end-joining DNA ligase [Candidatus Binatia bacterium]|jgi:bifunctional non-homologous end joining protein LigD
MPAPKRPRLAAAAAKLIPSDVNDVTLAVGKGREVRLTNLRKIFWPALGLTKGDLIRYYVTVSPLLLPHLKDRAMVMRRYPDGAEGQSFFMKRVPSPHPPWLELCSITHASGNVIDFPMIQDVPSLLWVVNLGCIDLNQWYARCDDVDRPDYLHFDLDPGPGAGFEQVRESALRLNDALVALGFPTYAKTTGSRGIHVYVPIVRGPTQHQVWQVAKRIAGDIARRHPQLMTVEYRVAKRPKGRVVIDFNQNAWGRTLASIYSVRPTPRASVSTPVTWREVASGIAIEDFRIDNVAARLAKRGDLWTDLLPPRKPRINLTSHVTASN